MRRVRIVFSLLLAIFLALAGWYRSLPCVVVLSDGLFLDTEWSQGDHDLFLPLLRKGWRLKTSRVERLPENKEELESLLSEKGGGVLVTSPRITRLITQWHVERSSRKLVGISHKEGTFSDFDAVLVEDAYGGYLEASQKLEAPIRLLSSKPVPDIIAQLFPEKVMVDGAGSDVYVESLAESWDGGSLVVYDVENLALFHDFDMVVPSEDVYVLPPDQIKGVIVSDYSPISLFASPLPRTRSLVTLPLESHFRFGVRMRGGSLAQALAMWKRKFL